jgi:hypothetical protein
MPTVYPDRVIAVRGAVENLLKAEVAMSKILNSCVNRNSKSSVSTSNIYLCRLTYFVARYAADPHLRIERGQRSAPRVTVTTGYQTHCER